MRRCDAALQHWRTSKCMLSGHPLRVISAVLSAYASANTWLQLRNPMLPATSIDMPHDRDHTPGRSSCARGPSARRRPPSVAGGPRGLQQARRITVALCQIWGIGREVLKNSASLESNGNLDDIALHQPGGNGIYDMFAPTHRRSRARPWPRGPTPPARDRPATGRCRRRPSAPAASGCLRPSQIDRHVEQTKTTAPS